MLVWIGVCVAIAVLGVAIVTFNELVAARNRVRTAWSDIDVELQRRHDLIPQLANVVQGYARHEQATFDAVATSRANAQAASAPAQRGEREAQLAAQVTRLIALQENYPQLKASENFLGLQRELAATEDRLQAARQAYNEAVRAYNTQLDTFPDALIARTFRFAAREFFQADPGSAAAPRV